MLRFLPSVIAALITAVLFGMCVCEFKRAADEPEMDFTGPGKFTFTAPVADYFTLWHKQTASIDGIYSVRENRLPTHPAIRLPSHVPSGSSISDGNFYG